MVYCDTDSAFVTPAKTAAEIRGIAGVVEHGLFLGMASLALIAGAKGVTKIGKLYGDRYNNAISRLAS